MTPDERKHLATLDHAHAWHPFTPMRQWREADPLIIESAEGDHLIDAAGNRYIDGTASMWCNVHGHRVPQIDKAIRDQLERVAHTTMLGLANVPATQLAARLAAITPGSLDKVFFSDSGATATEIAFKIAVGYHHHRGRDRHLFIALSGAYHGDTMGAMSVGYSDFFHRPYRKLAFRTLFSPAPDAAHTDDYAATTDRSPRQWSTEQPQLADAARDNALAELERLLTEHAGTVAAIVLEPIVQGAAGILVHPPGFLAAVADLAKQHDTLLIADEVATGFGRTGAMFACEHEHVTPDILCLGKGITGGYLPLAATLTNSEIESAFCGELHENRTLYHGHTYTGNPLAAAAALASLDLFETNDLLPHVSRKAEHLAAYLEPLRDPQQFPFVFDVRQRGLAVGIELAEPGAAARSWLTAPGGTDLGDFGESAQQPPPRRLAHDVCLAARSDGLIIRPLGNTIVLMPPLAITEANLRRMTEITLDRIRAIIP